MEKEAVAIKVYDVSIFMEDTRPRTRAEAHKAAVRALMRTKNP